MFLLSTQRNRTTFWLSAGAVVTVLTSAGWLLHGANQELDGKAPVSCGEAVRFLQAAHPPPRLHGTSSARVHVSGGTSN
ncbi:hypothetical protein [Streptomyces avidinii]